jgi:hypothetical protein
MGRLPVYGNSSHTWEDFICGQTSQIFRDFPHMRSHVCENFPYMERLPRCIKIPRIREDFRYIGSLPACGKTSHVSEDVPDIGKLPRYGKTSHVWEDFPYVRRLPRCRKTFQIYEKSPPYMARLPIYGKT